MNAPEQPDTLTVLYDGGCPLCRREIAHVKGLADRQPDSALCFVDISADAPDSACFAADRTALLARFHVQRADGSRLDGAAAFAAMWARLPGWRWLARLARLPGMLPLLEWAYRRFLRVRPWLQARARRFDPAAAQTCSSGCLPPTDATPPGPASTGKADEAHRRA